MSGSCLPKHQRDLIKIISKALDIPWKKVKTVIVKWRKYGTTVTLPRTGRPSKIDEKTKRKLVREATKRPTSTLKELQEYLPFLTKKNIQARVHFAKTHLKSPKSMWEKVVWSDETKVELFGHNSKKYSSVKYPQSVMVWGAMSAAGVGPLCFIKGRVNAASYQEILEHFMLPSAEKLYGDEDFIFQHDLAPAHSAKTTGKWFTDHGITVLNWPANSPDLNPIENLWDIVKRKLRDTRPNTLDELKAAIEASWASITPEQCHRLIASMPRHIEAVISAKGFPTKY
uniref:Tc1-like transposase DDE domain-containing protein n=1 Tax=Xenopus tropicalis TaxID=8364 RepID=A0A803KET0_XENTR